MIEISTKVHDRYSIELKVGFVTRVQQRMNDFSLAMWIFVPGSLDINRLTYPKEMFYQDLKSNIRLITPEFQLHDIAGGDAFPLARIREACETMAAGPSKTSFSEYEYQVKMFVAIVKSALRDELKRIRQIGAERDSERQCITLIEDVERISAEYSRLWIIVNIPSVPEEERKKYSFGDEFLGDILEKGLLDLMTWMKEQGFDALCRRGSEAFRKIDSERIEKGYPVVDPDDPLHNRSFIHRFSVLKKYIESELYLKFPKKKDGVLVEQLYLSIAAGLAMLFATVVSFVFQKKFGSLTLPLFIALIVSYMLKDRIKELMRYYFAHRIGSKYFDSKARIIHNDTVLGWMKEGVDFISREKVPSEVMAIRSNSHLTEVENSITDEKVILYRKSVHVDREKLRENSEYSFNGINDIIRLNVMNFSKKMDDPKVPVSTLGDDGEVKVIECDRAYFMNMILQYQYDNVVEYRRFRVAFSRDGIHSIEEVK